MNDQEKTNSDWPDSRGPAEDRLDELVAEYVDRLTAGEFVDKQQILRDHPDLGPDLLERLEVFHTISPAASPEPLGTLGDYKLRRQIGRGGMGIVYDAWEGAMDRQVALKVLPAAVAADSKTLHRFVREAQVAGSLHHPNVVPVYGMGVKEKTPYYTMEYVEGETLAQILGRLRSAAGAEAGAEKGRLLSSLIKLLEKSDPATAPDAPEAVLPDEKTLDLEGEGPTKPAARSTMAKEVTPVYCYRLAATFASVADGLQHAHSKRVVHRDIKPSNLILDGDGRLRILDFGLARLEGQESLTMSGDLLGTVQYMSPEQAMARRIPIDHRTDIYSLGATLYEMLTFQPPFEGQSYQDTLSKIVLRDPQPPRRLQPRIPHDLETIVLKCLRKDPRDRYSTAEALAQDLRRFVRGDPIEARPQPGWERLARRAWRARVKVAAVGFGVLFLVAVGLLGLSQWRERERVASEERTRFYEETVLENVGRMEFGESLRQAPRLGRRRSEPSASSAPRRIAHAAGSPTIASPLYKAIDELKRAAEGFPDRPQAWYHLARALDYAGRQDEAMAALHSALGADPGFAKALILQALILERRGDVHAARAKRGAAASLSGDAWTGAWLEAYRAEEARRWPEAILAYTKLLRETKKKDLVPYLGFSLNAYLGRGRAYLAAEQYIEALEDFATARTLRPELATPSLYIAETYLLLGHPDKAERRFEELMDVAAAPDDVALQVSHLYQRLDNCQKALTWAERATESPEQLSLRISSLTNLGRPAEAEHLAARGLARFQDDAELHRVQGDSLRELGQHERALAAYGKAIESDPKSAVAAAVHHNRGHLLWILGRLEEALEDHLQAIELEPKTGPYTNAAITLNRLGRPQEALFYAKKAVEIDPQDATFHLNLGIIYKDLGRTEDALKSYREAVQLDPTDSMGHSEIGGALAIQGHFEEAIESYGEALLLSPPRIDALRVRINRGICFMKLARLKEAAEELEEALRLEPKSSSALKRLGVIHITEGDSQTAIRRLREALAVDPEDGRIHSALAVALLDAGQREDAEEAFRNAVRLRREGSPHPQFGSRASIPFLAEELEQRVRAIADPPTELLEEAALTFLAEKQETGKALDWAGRAVKSTGGSDAVALAVLGRVEFAAGNRQRGFELLEKATSLSGNDPSFRRELAFARFVEGVAQEEKGNLDAAVSQYRKALEADSDAPASVLARLAWILVSHPDESSRTPGEAAELATRGVELAPNSASMWRILGLARRMAGQYEKAIEAFEKSVQLSGEGGPWEWLSLAIAKWQLGKKDEAEYWYQKFQESEDQHKELTKGLEAIRDEARTLLEKPRQPHRPEER